MSKTKTILFVFVALLLADNACPQQSGGGRPGGYSRRNTRLAGAAAQQKEQSVIPDQQSRGGRPGGYSRRSMRLAGAAAQQEEQSGIPEVTISFIPFDEKEKIKYEDAVERAKTNDSEAFYWLAYYFLRGEGVGENHDAAGKFLQRAVDACHAKACYLAGLYHEYYSLLDEHNRFVWGSNGLLPDNERRAIERVLQKAGIYGPGSISLKMPKRDDSNNAQTCRPRRLGQRDNTINCCCTNDVATGFVISLYSTTVKGGLSYATNDIARLKRTIAKCRERIAVETEAREKAQKKGAAALNLLMDGEGIPGVTIPFIPFNEKDKIKYEETIERAEKNDAKAFFWLAYYFAKGESVDRDGDSALKFLKKAADANDPIACYTLGLLLENDGLQNEDGYSVGDRETERGFRNLHFNLRPFGAAAWYTPVSRDGNKCLTNKVAVAHVESLYQKAVAGGLSYATNDIARLHRKVAECERRITQKKMEQNARLANAEKAKALIRDSKEENKKRQEEETGKQDETRRRWDRYRQEQEFWSSWPTSVDDDTLKQLISDVEKKFNCTFIPYIMTHRVIIRNGLLRPTAPAPHSTNTWFRTSGKALIVQHNETFQKIDSEGRIVAWGFDINETDLEEFRYFESEKEKRLAPLRSKWAKERGMSLEEAMQKYKVWEEQSRMSPLPPPPSSRLSGLAMARARRQARLQAEAREAEKRRQEAEPQMQKEREREKKEREQAAEERKAQLEQLMQIQKELRLQREEKIRREQENGRP